MPGLSNEQRKILDMFKYGAEHLDNIVNGLSEKGLDHSMEPGAWSIRQHIQHVADDSDVWSMVIKKAIATPGARIRFEDFPGNDAWADAVGYSARSVDAAVALVKDHRRVLAELVELFPDRWDQAVVFVDSDGKELGKATVTDTLKGQEGHLHDHLEVIESIKKQHGLGYTKLFTPKTPFVGADVFVLNDTNELCLIQREDNKLWCMPGGHQDLGETPAECAAREFFEETGLQIEVTGLIGVFSSLKYRDITNIHGDREYAHITFSGNVTGGEVNLSWESLQIRWFPENRLPALSDGHEKRISHAFAMLNDDTVKPYFE